MKINREKLWYDTKLSFRYVFSFFTLAVLTGAGVRYLRGEIDITVESFILGLLSIPVCSVIITGAIVLFSLGDYHDK